MHVDAWKNLIFGKRSLILNLLIIFIFIILTIAFIFSSIKQRDDELWRCDAKKISGLGNQRIKDELLTPNTIDGGQWVHVSFFGHYKESSMFLQSITMALKSLLWNRRIPTHVHLIGNEGSNPLRWVKLIERCNYVNFRISGHVLPSSLEKEYGFSRHFAKLLIEKTLEHDSSIEKIIQLDSDIVVLDDIGKLWNEFSRFNDMQAIGLVPEFNGMYAPQDQKQYHQGQNCIHGLPSFGQTGFNTGIMLMDLKKLRRMNWWESVHKVLNDVSKCHLPMQDQDVINEYLYRNPKVSYVLPFQWNIQQYCYMDLELNCPNHTVSEISIIHWNGNIKYMNHLKEVMELYQRLDPYSLDMPYLHVHLVEKYAKEEIARNMRTHKNVKPNPLLLSG